MKILGQSAAIFALGIAIASTILALAVVAGAVTRLAIFGFSIGAGC